MLLHCGSNTLDLSAPVVMGVLNVTPDSFSDGGRYLESRAAVEHARRMIDEGAAIIDVGGESTRPGATYVESDEELRRVLPVIEQVARLATLVSIDTSKPEVMRAATESGASMINDVRALRAEGAIEAVRDSRCGVCLMHMQGEPATMQQAPRYDDVVGEVRAFLVERAEQAIAAGVTEVWVDPGIGFGKTPAHNLTLLRRLDEIVAAGYDVLVGTSRKGFLGALTGGAPPDDRLEASLATAVMAAAAGARMVRAHDVLPTVHAMRIVGEEVDAA